MIENISEKELNNICIQQIYDDCNCDRCKKEKQSRLL